MTHNLKDAELKQDIDKYMWDSEQGGSFKKTICKAIVIADMNNLERLYKSYPRLVNGYIGYTRGMDWEQFRANINN